MNIYVIIMLSVVRDPNYMKLEDYSIAVSYLSFRELVAQQLKAKQMENILIYQFVMRNNTLNNLETLF